MDEYEKELMKKNLEVSQESLKILKKMNRARIVGGTLKFFKWAIIIGISLGSYYYIEPYLRPVIDTFNSVSGGANNVRQAGNATNPNNTPPDALDKLKNLLLPK